MRAHLPRLLLLAAAVALVGLRPGRPASADKIHDGDADNYAIHIPDTWSWDRVDDLAKIGVREAAKRRLEMLADGKTTGTGEGGRLLLSVQDVPKDFEPEYETWLAEWQQLELSAEKYEELPEELHTKIRAAREKINKALEVLVAREDVKSLLLNRWDKDPKKWPAHEVDAANLRIARVPAGLVKASSPCANLDGTLADCEGRVHVWIIRKKMYRLAMWAWPTKHDREHVTDDLDTIEFAFEVPKSEAIPKKALPPPPGLDPADAPKVDGDSAEVTVVKEADFGFQVTKAKKFKTVPVDRSKPDQRNLGFRFDAIHGPSSAVVDLLVYRIKGGAEPFNLSNYLTNLWTSFQVGHPKGSYGTMPFATVSAKAPFLSLPDFAKKKEVKRTPPDERVSVSDMERFGVVSEAKGATIKKERVGDATRFCLSGVTERAGEDCHVHYAFSTDDRVYILRVTVRKEGWGLFKEEIAEILKSFEIVPDAK